MKCFKCKCDCSTNCNHPCRYHFSDKCPDNKIKSKEKKDLTYFVKTNLPHVTTPMTLFTTTEDSQSLSPNGHDVSQNEELIMLINHSCTGDNKSDEVCLATSTKKETNLLSFFNYSQLPSRFRRQLCRRRHRDAEGSKKSPSF